MTEQLPYRRLEQRISRRKLLLRSVGAAVAATSLYKLSEGVSLGTYPLEVRPVFVERFAEDVQLFSEEISEEGEEKLITITPEGKLLFEPSGMFFAPGREFKYVHRGGNSFKAIEEAYAKGADLFDIDANDVNGMVHGEHGIIPHVQLELGKLGINLYLPAVLDINEKEVKLGMPSTYEELVAHIASLSTPERPLAISTELKRGEFELSTLERMVAIHQAYNIPAVVHSPDPERLTLVGSELAALYNIPG